MEHFGYKRCGNYIVKLFIPAYAVTNELRPGVVNRFRAKHRTNVAYVTDIIHEYGINSPKSVISTFHKKWLRYEIGKKIESTDFDYNLRKVCAPGIHYFLSYEQALNYDGKDYTWIGRSSASKIDGLVFYYNGNGENVYTIEFRNNSPQKIYYYCNLKK